MLSRAAFPRAKGWQSLQLLQRACPSPLSCARRGFFKGASDLPDGTVAMALLDKCREKAIGRGINFDVPYEPWLPVDLMQTLLIDTHEAVGCTWATAIVLTVLCIRVVTLPVSISALRGARQKALIQPEFNGLMQKMKEAKGQEEKAKIERQVQLFTQRHGRFFMLKGTWGVFFLQMPLYITAFMSTRGLANYPDLFPGFAMESPLWLESLALPDPYYLMPIITSAIMLTNIELFGAPDTEVAAVAPGAAQSLEQSSAPQVAGQGSMQRYQKWLMRGSAVMLVPMTSWWPSSTFMFMATNIMTSTLQNRVLRLPTVERLLDLPPLPDPGSNDKKVVPRHPTLANLGDKRQFVQKPSMPTLRNGAVWNPPIKPRAAVT